MVSNAPALRLLVLLDNDAYSWYCTVDVLPRSRLYFPVLLNRQVSKVVIHTFLNILITAWYSVPSVTSEISETALMKTESPQAKAKKRRQPSAIAFDQSSSAATACCRARVASSLDFSTMTCASSTLLTKPTALPTYAVILP